MVAIFLPIDYFAIIIDHFASDNDLYRCNIARCDCQMLLKIENNNQYDVNGCIIVVILLPNDHFSSIIVVYSRLSLHNCRSLLALVAN